MSGLVGVVFLVTSVGCSSGTADDGPAVTFGFKVGTIVVFSVGSVVVFEGALDVLVLGFNDDGDLDE